MLRLSIPVERPSAPWTQRDGTWYCGSAFVEPYAHPALETLVRTTPAETAFVVRERLAGTPRGDGAGTCCAGADSLDALRDAVLRWPLDSVCVVVSRDPSAPVTLQAGSWGTAPLYLVGNADALYADWDPARLYPYLSGAIDMVRAARSLVTLGYPYSKHTLFPDMLLLTERARARWVPSTASVDMTYPPEVSRPRAGRLTPDADVIAAFEGAMRTALARWFDPEHDTIAVELSGGLDSSAAAIIAARLAGAPVRSYGMIMPEANGRYQTARRDELIRRFALRDRTVAGKAYPPLRRTDGGAAKDAVVPWGEYYAELVTAMLDGAVADGSSTIVTGMGGDEISTLSHEELYAVPARDAVAARSGDGGDEEESELPLFLTSRAVEAFDASAQLDVAPEGAVERSCFESALAGAPVYLRAGAWPVSPYCDPRVVRLCRRLPFEWRYGRTLQRTFLRARGCSDSVAHPIVTETFRPIMRLAMRQKASTRVRTLFAESRLAELGLVDRTRLLAVYDAYLERGDEKAEDSLFEAAVLETALRCVESASGSAVH